jgi:hypothetical protein
VDSWQVSYAKGCVCWRVKVKDGDSSEGFSETRGFTIEKDKTDIISPIIPTLSPERGKERIRMRR